MSDLLCRLKSTREFRRPLNPQVILHHEKLMRNIALATDEIHKLQEENEHARDVRSYTAIRWE